MAPGTEDEALQDPGKRPQEPYEPSWERLRNLEPDTQFQLDKDNFARNVRSAKRGSAPGPSGMTTDTSLEVAPGHPVDVQTGRKVCTRTSA